MEKIEQSASVTAIEDNMPDFDSGEILPHWKVVALRELGETAEVMSSRLAELRALIEEDVLLHCPTDDAFLLKFLRCRKYQIDDTFNTIQTYFRSRRDHPDMYSGLRPHHFNCDLLVREHRLLMLLKERDSLGRAVGLLRLGAWNTDICSFLDLLRAAIVLAEYTLQDEETQVHGVIVLVDFDGMQFYHIRHFLPHIRRVVHLIQDCYPVRLKGIYAVNCPAHVEILLAMMKPFMKTKLLNRIHILRNSNQELHDVISPEVLPPEFGGSRSDYDSDDLEARLQSKHHFFEEIEKYGYCT